MRLPIISFIANAPLRDVHTQKRINTVRINRHRRAVVVVVCPATSRLPAKYIRSHGHACVFSIRMRVIVCVCLFASALVSLASICVRVCVCVLSPICALTPQRTIAYISPRQACIACHANCACSQCHSQHHHTSNRRTRTTHMLRQHRAPTISTPGHPEQ